MDKENEIVIFLHKESFDVKNKQDDGDVELTSFWYYNIENNTAGQLTMRSDNIQSYGADKITLGENNIFKVFAISREWERNRNYQNLKFKSVVDTGQVMELKEIQLKM